MRGREVREVVGVAPPERLGIHELADGRLLGWSEWGPQDGRAVLLCAGAATGRWLGFGTDAVHTWGVRLIGVDRPGLGVSTPAPGRSLQDFAADIRMLFDERGIGSPFVVGHSQGAPFALACAASGQASALCLVAGADEVASPRFAGTLDEHLESVVGLCARDPASAYALFSDFDAEALWRLVVDGSSPCDRDIYTEPVFASAYRRALAEGFAQGADGYATDTVLAMRRWSLDLERITCPVDIWYGEKDATHSPDLGATLAARLPRARYHLVSDAGGALLWTHAEWWLRRSTGHY